MNKSIAVLAALVAASSVSAQVVGRVAVVSPAMPTFSAAPSASAIHGLQAAMAPSAFAPSLSAAPLLAAPALAAAPAVAAAAAAPIAASPAAGVPAAAVPAVVAAPAGAPALGLLRNAAASVPNGPSSSDFASGRASFDGAQFAPPDNVSGWVDQHTGQWETQTSKLKKAYDLALTHPLAAGIKNGLSRNTVYRVDNSGGNWYLHTAVRTQADDNEKTNEPDALVIFNHNALQQLSPEYLAAKLASMWVRHLYRDTLPASAEKTYVEGSVLVRVFKDLTGSTAQTWNGSKDYFIGGTFELYRHFYNWIQGFRFANVRQGPYFLDKIMHAQGDPSIDTDARGRMTLFQRSQAGQITPEAAEAAQHRFDGFVSNEQH
jgi:hypothetical protein